MPEISYDELRDQINQKLTVVCGRLGMIREAVHGQMNGDVYENALKAERAAHEIAALLRSTEVAK